MLLILLWVMILMMEKTMGSNKQLALIFGISIIGIFLVFALFITPIQNLFPNTLTEQVTIISKSKGNALLTVKIIQEVFQTVLTK